MEPGARGQSAALSGTSHDHARRTSAQVNRHFGWLRMGAPGRVPPAGFELALTAPEADPVHRFYLAKRTVPVRLGSVWGSAGYELLDQDAATSFDQRQGRGARASWSAAWWSTHTGAVNSQQTDDADRLAAAAKRQRPVRGFRGGFPGSP